MKTHKPMSTALKAVTCFLLLTITFTSVTSARMIYEVEPPAPTEALEPIDAPMNEVPSLGATPTEDLMETPINGAPLVETAATAVPVVTPDTDVPHLATVPTAGPTLIPIADPKHPMSFYMDNILGGSNPSTQAVTGVASNQIMNDVPLPKSNRAAPPVKGGIPLKNANYRIIENKNLPLHTVLNGTTDSALQNNTKNMDNGGDELPFGNRAQLSLDRVMFGTMNVFDVELTGEPGSGLVGKAQGFYVVSSKDASSLTMMFTAVFNSENYADTLSFFGVRNTAVSESHLAIMGGTGKYTSAKGFATITAITSTSHISLADEAKSLLRFSVFLA